MQIATWNVNSLKVRLPQVLDWLATHPDITALALQETKQEDAAFPQAEIEAAGLHVAFAGQKTYNGVAIVSRVPLADISINIPGFDDPQKRVIAATLPDGTRLICVYVPNGQALDSEKYPYKLAWLNALTAWLKTELAHYPRLAVLGDFNIAPEDRDVHDPANGSTRFWFPHRNAQHSTACLNLACMIHSACSNKRKNRSAGGIIAALASRKTPGCGLITFCCLPRCKASARAV